ISEQYAGLAGFRLHLRRTTKPFPADEWARTVDQLTPAPLPNVPGAPSWADHLVAAQHHLLSVNHAEGQTYLGVTFARRTLGDTRASCRWGGWSRRRRPSRTSRGCTAASGCRGRWSCPRGSTYSGRATRPATWSSGCA